MIEPHVDVHPDDFPKVFPVVGVVKNVVCKDDPRNVWGEMTLYDISVFLQWPPTSSDMELVPYLGQHAGGGSCGEDPLLIGQKVEVGFMEGDENRPHITKTFPSNEPGCAQTKAEHPHVRYLRSGTLAEIDKAGNVAVTLAEGASLTVKDKDGTILEETKNVGGSYKKTIHVDVELGGDSGLKKLMTEVAAGLIEGHIHDDPMTGVTGPAKNGATLLPLDLSGGLTTKTRAK